MSFEQRTDAERRRTRPPGWTGGESRDEARGAASAPPPRRPVVDGRGRAIITPKGYPLFL